MRIVISSHVKIHSSARDRFARWSQQHGRSFAELKEELESTQGQPAGSMLVGKDYWTWKNG